MTRTVSYHDAETPESATVMLHIASGIHSSYTTQLRCISMRHSTGSSQSGNACPGSQGRGVAALYWICRSMCAVTPCNALFLGTTRITKLCENTIDVMFQWRAVSQNLAVVYAFTMQFRHREVVLKMESHSPTGIRARTALNKDPTIGAAMCSGTSAIAVIPDALAAPCKPRVATGRTAV